MNTNTINNNNLETKVQIDLSVFSKRLIHKLEKALNIVQELKDFFKMNITRIIHFMDDYDDSDSDDEDHNHHTPHQNKRDNDQEDNGDLHLPLETDLWPDFDNDLYDQTLSSKLRNLAYPCLESYIDSCHGIENTKRHTHNTDNHHHQHHGKEGGENYNHQQIQIVNYDKVGQQPVSSSPSTGAPLQQHNHHAHHGLNDAMTGSISVLNTYIQIKINSLKVSQESPTPVATGSGAVPATASKDEWMTSKCLRSHVKHIYFISTGYCDAQRHPGYLERESMNIQQGRHFPYLFVSAIERKYTFIMLDIGSDMNLELWELTKAYGK